MRTEELHPYGTFAELLPDESTKSMLLELIDRLGLANPIDPDKIHTTLIYSRKPCPDIETMHGRETPYEGRISKLTTWPTQDGNRCLVALVECEDAEQLHHRLRETYGATHDYPDYTPHFTLSYDCGDEFELPAGEYPVAYSKMHVKALDPDWKG